MPIGCRKLTCPMERRKAVPVSSDLETKKFKGRAAGNSRGSLLDAFQEKCQGSEGTRPQEESTILSKTRERDNVTCPRNESPSQRGDDANDTQPSIRDLCNDPSRFLRDDFPWRGRLSIWKSTLMMLVSSRCAATGNCSFDRRVWILRGFDFVAVFRVIAI